MRCMEEAFRLCVGVFGVTLGESVMGDQSETKADITLLGALQ